MNGHGHALNSALFVYRNVNVNIKKDHVEISSELILKWIKKHKIWEEKNHPEVMRCN